MSGLKDFESKAEDEIRRKRLGLEPNESDINRFIRVSAPKALANCSPGLGFGNPGIAFNQLLVQL